MWLAGSPCSVCMQFMAWVELCVELTVCFIPAVLAAGAPEQAAFMSDEAVESVPGLKPIKYTAKHYDLFLRKMVERTKKLNKGEEMTGTQLCRTSHPFCFSVLDEYVRHQWGNQNLTFCAGTVCRPSLSSSVDPGQDWTPHRLELCLWAWAVATRQQLPLLDEVDMKGGSVAEKRSDEDQRPTKKLRTK